MTGDAVDHGGGCREVWVMSSDRAAAFIRATNGSAEPASHRARTPAMLFADGSSNAWSACSSVRCSPAAIGTTDSCCRRRRSVSATSASVSVIAGPAWPAGAGGHGARGRPSSPSPRWRLRPGAGSGRRGSATPMSVGRLRHGGWCREMGADAAALRESSASGTNSAPAGIPVAKPTSSTSNGQIFELGTPVSVVESVWCLVQCARR
jgi:hypothetical protein